MVNPSSSVLNRFLTILDSFTAEHPEMGVREAAHQANLSPSTTGRLMAEMKELGVLQQNPLTQTYTLGSRVLVWAGVYVSCLSPLTTALPFMEELRKMTGETITLYLLEGTERLCVERIESHQSVRMVSRVGQRLPLYAGSAGKVMLAYLPPEKAAEILEGTEIVPFTEYTPVNREDLKTELKQVRQQGYAVSHGEWTSDASGVSAPLLGHGGVVIGAITISGPSARFTPKKIAAYAVEVVYTAGQVSRLLGYLE